MPAAARPLTTKGTLLFIVKFDFIAQRLPNDKKNCTIGAILRYNGVEKELSGGAVQTTNNRMELTGVISALSALKESCAVELYSDSKYVIDALEKGWARSWRARGWVKSDKKPALNPDLWAQLLELCEKHEMHYHWVKGHADNEYNNRCDALAVEQRDRYASGAK